MDFKHLVLGIGILSTTAMIEPNLQTSTSTAVPSTINISWCYTSSIEENETECQEEEGDDITGENQVNSTDDSIYVKFETLKNKWEENTQYHSSMSEIVEDGNYKKIIQLGNDVVPMILNEMRVSPNHWFYALYEITKATPIIPEHYGDITKMTSDWINWGKKNNYIS